MLLFAEFPVIAVVVFASILPAMILARLPDNVLAIAVDKNPALPVALLPLNDKIFQTELTPVTPNVNATVVNPNDEPPHSVLVSVVLSQLSVVHSDASHLVATVTLPSQLTPSQLLVELLSDT